MVSDFAFLCVLYVCIFLVFFFLSFFKIIDILIACLFSKEEEEREREKGRAWKWGESRSCWERGSHGKSVLYEKNYLKRQSC